MTHDPITTAYIAGFFDGEGCISGKDGGRSIVISITQKERAPLDFIQEYFGVGHIYTQRDYWQYKIMRRADIATFLAAITPDLMVKRKKAEVALVWARRSYYTDRRIIMQQFLSL
jgi:hypothetical protein